MCTAISISYFSVQTQGEGLNSRGLLSSPAYRTLMSMTGNMKIWIVVVATIWCVAIVGPARVCSFPTVRFTTERATTASYSGFIAALRRELASGKASYGMPLLREASTVTDPNRFILVTLSNLERVSITLAIDVVNVYIVAYETSGKESYFFSDAPKPASSKLFPGTKRQEFKFSSSYIDLQRIAKVASREGIDLGISELDRAISSIDRTGREKDLKTVARSIIVSIQMISEAARFAYIEQVVVKSITATEYKKFKPDPAVLSFENKWEDLSKAIQNSMNGDFSKTPIELQRPDGSKFKVTKVDDSLRRNLKLLLATKKKASGSIAFLVKSIMDNYEEVPLIKSIFEQMDKL